METSNSQVMKNLSDSVIAFKDSLNAFKRAKDSFQIIAGIGYKEYCIQEAVFYLIEMERSARTLLDLPVQDQKQIIFWSIQMRDEIKKIIKDDFEMMYDIVLNGCENRISN